MNGNSLIFLLHQNGYNAERSEKRNWKGFPPYMEQAEFFNLLIKERFLPQHKDLYDILDYGSGVGSIFSSICQKLYNLKITCYEKFTEQSEGVQLLKQNPDKKFDIVFCSALLEHIRSLAPLEEMLSLINETGVFIFHTLVTEKIPQAPAWFYINFPLHCSLYTNKAMQCLMNKYGFSYSIYSPKAKSWIFYKNKPLDIENRIKKTNFMLYQNYLYGKDGFMDYWK